MTVSFRFSNTALDVSELQRTLADPYCGGYAAFEGWVRNHNEGQAVRRLEYEAFEALAVREGERILAEASERFGVSRAACVHRVGALELGDCAVWVGVSAAHRDEAFRACRYIIDEVKHRVPIWKKEHYVSGDSGWVNCERCAQGAQHDHSAEAARHDHSAEAAQYHPAAPAPRAPADYSRQTVLREVGAAGQARLAASQVAIIGAGGLGVPVMQYLAGAGVGQLRIIDGDSLDASNLHRQTLYTRAECGQEKAQLATARLRALNPDIDIIAHSSRLDAHNGSALLAECDLVVDCSDNFATKFVLNDLAAELGVPLLTASIYQFEGQLQLLDPAHGGACLRCLWPEATRDGVVGNCAEAGVLGPVPGVLGSLQALEALRVLLDLPGRLREDLLMVDLTTLQTMKLRVPRAKDCAAGACSRCRIALVYARAAAATPVTANLELDFETLEQACEQGYSIIDIREPSEIAAAPAPAREVRAVPARELIEGVNLPQQGRYLLVCARGARSRAAALALRSQGLTEVYSLRVGVLGLARETVG